MAIPRLKKCCCCCLSLRTGSYIIGTLFLFLSFSIDVLIWNSALRAANTSRYKTDDVVIFVLGAVFSAVLMTLNVVLLYGVRNYRPPLLLLWLKWYLGLMVYGALLLLCIAIAAFLDTWSDAYQLGCMLLGAAFVGTLIFSYCLIVVRSYYLDLTEYNSPVEAYPKKHGIMP